jgi:anthranilate phosphoribosyltransferase
MVAADGTPPPDKLTEALREAYERTGEVIDSGAATALLERWVRLSQSLRP